MSCLTNFAIENKTKLETKDKIKMRSGTKKVRTELNANLKFKIIIILTLLS